MDSKIIITLYDFMHLLKEYAKVKEDGREVFLEFPARQEGKIVSYIIEKNDRGEELSCWILDLIE